MTLNLKFVTLMHFAFGPVSYKAKILLLNFACSNCFYFNFGVSQSLHYVYFESLIGYRKGANANGHKTLSDVWGPKSKAVYNYNANQ